MNVKGFASLFTTSEARNCSKQLPVVNLDDANDSVLLLEENPEIEEDLLMEFFV
jgi:hypothetical protein